MRKIIIFGVVITLAACTPQGGGGVGRGSAGDVTGISFIKRTAQNADTAGDFYFECVMMQSALQEAGNRAGYQSLGKQELIDISIENCRPTGNIYARRILEETVDFDRRFYAENIRKTVLPDIEAMARKGLNDIID